MKQISDKINLAVRRCKQRRKKITAAEARNSNYVEKRVNLDEGHYIFRQLRNSPAYLETRKKDIFAMIRQLSLPTWFMSLSAADTRWTDLMKMLAKLNNGIEYSEKEIENLTWQNKKLSLSRKIQLYVQGILIIEYKSSLIQFLKPNVSQLERYKTIFTELTFNKAALLIFICLFG